jgi:hypothetical protein
MSPDRRCPPCTQNFYDQIAEEINELREKKTKNQINGDMNSDIARCRDSQILGLRNRWCKFISVEDGLVRLRMVGLHYLIPIDSLEFVIFSVKKEGETK